MKTYIGTKQLRAKPMTRGDYNTLRGWATPADELPGDEGYLVEYLDGGKANHPDFDNYISWSPKDVFERAYRPSSGMSFGLALELLKDGQKLARQGWNGAGQFVYLVPANAYQAQTGVAKAYWGEGKLVPYGAYLALKGVDGIVRTWVPSITDCLAEDWEVVK